MNIFLDSLPVVLTVGGRDYPIDADYRVGILTEGILSSRELTATDKVTVVIKNYFGHGDRIPESLADIDAAFEKALWFYRCGEESSAPDASSGCFSSSKEESSAPDASGGCFSSSDPQDWEAEPLYSFSFDAGRIYASFLQQYGVDVLAVRFLHWWKFVYLLKGLGPETPFARCADIRARKFYPGMSPEERRNLARLKAIYALPETRADRERMAAIYDALENGGNVSELLNHDKG